MKNQIAHGGLERLLAGQRGMRFESIEEKYAAELAKAGPDEKRKIYERMLEEVSRREKMTNHKPSAGALW